MSKNENIEKQNYIFGRLFLLANKLQVLGDHTLDGMTVRQWLLTIAVAHFKESSPTLNEVTGLMGTSHQNVKQLAVKLQEKGYLKIEKDIKDQRAICFILTDKCYQFWERRQEEIHQLLNRIFEDLKDMEVDLLYDSLNRLYESVSKKLKAVNKI